MTTPTSHGAPELLSSRVRPNIEAAPWVVDAIKALEAKYRAAIAPRPDAPTSQINHGSAPREDGHG